MLSSAAALLDGLFEHPGVVFFCFATCGSHQSSRVPQQFFRSLLLAGSSAFRFGESLSSSCKDMVKHRPGQ